MQQDVQPSSRIFSLGEIFIEKQNPANLAKVGISPDVPPIAAPTVRIISLRVLISGCRQMEFIGANKFFSVELICDCLLEDAVFLCLLMLQMTCLKSEREEGSVVTSMRRADAS